MAPEQASTSAPERAYLLGLVLLLVTLVTFAVGQTAGVMRVLAVLLQALTLLVLLRAARARRRLVLVAAIAGVVAVMLTTVAVAVASTAGTITSLALVAVLAVVAPPAILRDLASRSRITPGMVFGALCIYVLAGMLFAAGFGIVDAVTDGPFFAQTDAANQIDYLYFSFVTLATLGYGDLTPVGDSGRMLAVTETLLGQLYLVGVVAILVSNIGSDRRRRAASDDDLPTARSRP